MPILAEPTAAHCDAVRLSGLIGLPVFPLHTPDAGGCSCRRRDCGNIGKHPRTARGFHDATTDPKRVDGWWSLWPDANIGIPTGTVSGIAVLDVDPGKAGRESLTTLERDRGPLPVTVQARTGGDGDHYVFAHPGRLVRTRAGIAPGLDVRGDGGYFVTAPSLHLSGNRYVWLSRQSPFDHDPAPIPDSWLDVFCPEQTARSTPSRASVGTFELTRSQIASIIRLIGPAYREGQRHELTLAQAGWLATQGYGEATTAAMVEALAAGDSELPARLRNVATTYERLAAGEVVLGWRRLSELLPPAALVALERTASTEPRLIVGTYRRVLPRPGRRIIPLEKESRRAG